MKKVSNMKMISGRKYQGHSGFRLFTRRVESVKQAKFRLSDIQPVYMKVPAKNRPPPSFSHSAQLSCFAVNTGHGRLYESACEKPASAFIFALRAAFIPLPPGEGSLFQRI
jgi:hypothetical protein